MGTTGKTVQGSVSLKPLRSPPIPLNAAQAGSKIAASLASRCPSPQSRSRALCARGREARGERGGERGEARAPLGKLEAPSRQNCYPLTSNYHLVRAINYKSAS